MCDAKAQLRELVIRVRALILSASYELHFTDQLWETSVTSSTMANLS